jgi:DNA-binding MarR family transcriptional regulator
MNMMEGSTSRDEYLSLWLLMATVRDHMMRLRQKELWVQGITPQQSHVLHAINIFGEDVTLKQISKSLFRKVHTVSSQITRMEKLGLLKKIRISPRTNQIRFEITEKGMKAYEFSNKREAMYRLMSVLSEEERQTLVIYMNKLLDKSKEILQELTTE